MRLPCYAGSIPRPKLSWSDRAVLGALARVLAEGAAVRAARGAGHAAVLAPPTGRGEVAAAATAWPPTAPGRVGRAGCATGAGEPDLGVVRIQGELRRLGHRVAASIIRRIVRSQRIPPPRAHDASRRTFVRAHAETLPARNLFHIECAMSPTRLYVFFVIELETRRAHVLAITERPGAERDNQLVREYAWDREETGRRSARLIRDRDTKLTDAFDAASLTSPSSTTTPAAATKASGSTCTPQRPAQRDPVPRSTGTNPAQTTPRRPHQRVPTRHMKPLIKPSSQFWISTGQPEGGRRNQGAEPDPPRLPGQPGQRDPPSVGPGSPSPEPGAAGNAPPAAKTR